MIVSEYLYGRTTTKCWTVAAVSGSVYPLDTLDSFPGLSLDRDEGALPAQQEQEESIGQFQKPFSFVLLPMVGKHFGHTLLLPGEPLSTYGTGGGLYIPTKLSLASVVSWIGFVRWYQQRRHRRLKIPCGSPRM